MLTVYHTALWRGGILGIMILQIGVKVLLTNSNNELLFLKRKEQLSIPGDSKDSWDIPGGRIGPEESLDDALVREVKEETGALLNGVPMLINAQDIFVPKKDLHVVRLTYRLRAEIKNITLSDEHTDYKWMTLEESKQLSLEPFLKATLDLLK